MRRVAKFWLSLTVSLLAASSWAAKPAPAPDTTAPDPIADLEVMAAVRSLTLRFTATGDDGTSGTAARYDVRYAGVENCPGSPGPSWAVAARSELQKPIAAGNADAFVVRPLAAGTAYCLAIRVLDEASNPSVWAMVSATTLGAPGDFPLATVPPDLSASASPENLSAEWPVGVADELPASGEPRVLAAWAIADHPITTTTNHRIGIRFAALSVPASDAGPVPVCSPPNDTDCAETILLSGPLLAPYLDTLSARLAIAPIPEADTVGILVIGTKAAARRNKPAEPRSVLLERNADGVWTSELLPFHVDGGTLPALTYVPSSRGSEPVVTWVSSANTLMLAERSTSGWNDTPLVSRSQSGFFERLLFSTPEGDLGVWVSASPYGPEPAIYAVRSPAGAEGTWTFYDAGPRDSNFGARYYASAFDADGNLVVATAPFPGSEVLAINQFAFGSLPPAAPASPSGSDLGSLWTEIVKPVGGASYSRVAGLSAAPCGGLQVVTTSAYPLPVGSSMDEVRVASYDGGPSAESSPVDHVWSGTPAAVGLPNGDLAVVTAWLPLSFGQRYSSQPTQDVYLARHAVGGACLEP